MVNMGMVIPTSPNISNKKWPSLSKDYREVSQVLANILKRQRGQDVDSTLQEVNLDEDLRKVLNEVLVAPQKHGLGLSQANKLQTDDNFRTLVLLGAKVYASHLYPLSLLIYGMDLEDITCISHNHWVGRKGGVKLEFVEGSPFKNDGDVVSFLEKVLAIRGVTGDTAWNTSKPIAEANFGSVVRLSVARKPAISGVSNVYAAIRVPARSKVTSLEDYIREGVMSRGIAEFIQACVMGRANIMIAGGTSTGKTTFLRVLCSMVYPGEQIVVIEDGAELHLDSVKNLQTREPWVKLPLSFTTIPSVRADTKEAPLTMGDIVRNALRFNPDRIILGESRGAEMASVCKALMTGHDGSMTTIHAEDALLAIEQATQYVMEESRFSGNEKMAKRVVEQAIHVVVHLANQNGTRRVTGLVAVEKGGNHKWIYEQNANGGWDIKTHLIGDLPRLSKRIQPFLPGKNVPVP